MINTTLINEYLDAFRRVNPELPAPTITYAMGWYKTPSGQVREKTLIQMRDNLLKRLL